MELRRYLWIIFAGLSSLIALCADLSAQTLQDTQANGSKTNSLITGVPFLLITPDARAGAMGEAGVAVLPDINSMSINPSKLAFLEQSYGFSVSYTPWLKNLDADINLAYLSGFYKADDLNTIGASLRYFSIGEVQLFDVNKQDLGAYNPNEFAFDVTYARKFGNSFSLGTALRYIRSSLNSGQTLSSQEIKPGNAMAVDVSAYMREPTMLLGSDALLAFGLCISNIGAKISYSDAAGKYFLPANLKIGAASTFMFDDFNELTVALDLNKLLVPTQPEYDVNGLLIRGEDPNRSVPSGIFGSFADAPGGLSEEIKEVNLAAGVEYIYNHQFASRFGYFYESPQKGGRSYFTLGAGLKYRVFNLDFAYLIADTGKSPLANTLRFSLLFSFH